MCERINQQGLPPTGRRKIKVTLDHERNVPVVSEDGGQNEEVSDKKFKHEESGNKSEECLCEGKKEKVESYAYRQAVDDENKEKKVAVQQEDFHGKSEDIQGPEAKDNIGTEKEKQACAIAPANLICKEEEKDEVGAEAREDMLTDKQIEPHAGANLCTAKEMSGRRNIGIGIEEDNKACAMGSGSIDREECAPETRGRICLPVEEEGEASVKENVGAEEDEQLSAEASTCGVVVITYGSGENKKVKFVFIDDLLKDNEVPEDDCLKNIQECIQESL